MFLLAVGTVEMKNNVTYFPVFLQTAAPSWIRCVSQAILALAIGGLKRKTKTMLANPGNMHWERVTLEDTPSFYGVAFERGIWVPRIMALTSKLHLCNGVRWESNGTWELYSSSSRFLAEGPKCFRLQKRWYVRRLPGVCKKTSNVSIVAVPRFSSQSRPRERPLALLWHIYEQHSPEKVLASCVWGCSSSCHRIFE